MHFFLFTIALISFTSADETTSAESQRYDGWYNNLAHPDWGAVGSRLYRRVKSHYADDIYMVDEHKPNARSLSDLVFSGPDGLRHQRNMTTMLAFFSQVVAYDIMYSTESSCPMEMLKIPLKQCDSVYDKACRGSTMMPFFRVKYDPSTGKAYNAPREQINDATSWIDGSFVYSTLEPWIHMMRSFRNGTLKENKQLAGYPPLNSERLPLINPAPPKIHKVMTPERLFELGDPRSNENPGLLSFSLLFYRWHNYLANKIQSENPKWSDGQVFERARQWVIATLQKITLYDFLPAYLQLPVRPYSGYNSNIPVGISHLFSVAAFRHAHTLVPPAMFARSGQCSFQSPIDQKRNVARLCNTWWNSQEFIKQYGLEQVILGMASQISESDDTVIVDDLRNFIFGPIHFSRRDLVAMTIMRGRDHGLADYNSVREAFGLPKRNWSEINVLDYELRPDMYHRLMDLYGGKIEDLDVYVGGMLESTGTSPGELFQYIILEQFYRLRDGDRFWFENRDNNLFNDAELKLIKRTTLYDIILASINVTDTDLQPDVFVWRDGDPCPQPYQVNSSGYLVGTDEMEPCVPFLRFDHFHGNEMAFIFTCSVLAAIPLVCFVIGLLMIRQRKKVSETYDSIREELRGNKKEPRIVKPPCQETHSDKGMCWKITAIEWLHEHCSRQVMVQLGPDTCVYLEKKRGGLLRRADFTACVTVSVAVSDDQEVGSTQPFALFILPNDYDMVLRFDTSVICGKFLLLFEEMLRRDGKSLRVQYLSSSAILQSAETKEKRQIKVEHFFREAYAKAFKIGGMHNADQSLAYSHRHISPHVLETTLTRAEFADAIGMREDDVFVQRMFAAVARSHIDRLSFQEFLNMVVMFSNGSIEQRVQIVYDMCDRHGTGLVDRREFTELMKSIGTVAGIEVTDSVVQYSLEAAGVPRDQQQLSYKDFEAILTEVKQGRKSLGLHCKGTSHLYNDYLAERESLNSFAVPQRAPTNKMSLYFHQLSSWLEDYRQHVTCLTLFFFICIALFFERFRYYSQMQEHRELRRVMGYGIAVTRGSAAALSFSYSVLLLTACKSVITKLRETPVNDYIPLDYATSFHKIIALTSVVFAAIHAIGHVINFYQVATQPHESLQCLFPSAVFSSDFQPSITYWFFLTPTGISGVFLVVIISIMYIFSMPSIINNCYYAFRITHLLHVLFYALMIVHGLPKLIDQPKFWYFLIGPMTIFILDRIMQLRQNYRELEIVSATLLPSEVTYLRFKRPRNFHFRSGQWVRISCPAFNCKLNEWHAFSLASAPQESVLEIYAKAQGCWTWKLRRMVYQAQQADGLYPVLHMTGPYGGGNQDWFNYDVCVMVGGGIGVTPYAAILLDLVNSTSSARYSDVACKKVYFLWVCPSHKSFEWFVRVLEEVEQLDKKSVLEIHIFITQFFHKFDLRTTMLYICETHFQRVEGRSLFTNLKAKNHFGRPNMKLFLQYVQKQHEKQSNIGVFSCGPGTLNKGVRSACEEANRSRDAPHFIHRYETF